MRNLTRPAKVFYRLLNGRPFKSYEYIAWMNDNATAYCKGIGSPKFDPCTEEYQAFIEMRWENKTL